MSMELSDDEMLALEGAFDQTSATSTSYLDNRANYAAQIACRRERIMLVFETFCHVYQRALELFDLCKTAEELRAQLIALPLDLSPPGQCKRLQAFITVYEPSKKNIMVRACPQWKAVEEQTERCASGDSSDDTPKKLIRSIEDFLSIPDAGGFRKGETVAMATDREKRMEGYRIAIKYLNGALDTCQHVRTKQTIDPFQDATYITYFEQSYNDFCDHFVRKPHTACAVPIDVVTLLEDTIDLLREVQQRCVL